MTLWEKRERARNDDLFPAPAEGATVLETPPCFSWLPAPGEGSYTVVVKNRNGEVLRGECDENCFVPEKPLPPGDYTWDVIRGDSHRGETRFTVSPDAIPFLRPTPEEVLAGVPAGHPRHLFAPADISALLAERREEAATLRRTVDLALADPIPDPPRFCGDPSALPYREYFGRFREACDRDLVALSLDYALFGDPASGEAAKARLLAFVSWDPDRECSLESETGDEIGLSLARCLPAVYDLLYPLLSDGERATVARRVADYARQCERRLRKLDYLSHPGNSHAGRLPAYLGEAALVLADAGVVNRATLLSWLGYALRVYGGIFPHYGGTDGGWAEGPFYATSYVRWFLPFFSAVERYTGKSLFARPFYRNLTRFLLAFCDPSRENHPFGDGYWSPGESDAEWPGFFAQNPYRYYARRFGPPSAEKRSRELESPAYYKLHLLDLFLPVPRERTAPEPGRLVVFPDTGLLALRTAPDAPERDLVCLVRASRFGSDSHRHPDQGGFALFCGGVSLLSPSGYFGRRYGTKHHREWTNTSRAHNVPLFGGVGQYENDYRAVGTILSAEEDGETLRATVFAGGAYPVSVGWTRRFTLVEGALTVTDEFSQDEPREITLCLHTLSRPAPDGNGFRLTRRGVTLICRPTEGIDAPPEISDVFAVDVNEGEPAEYAVSMPEQYHVFFRLPADRRRASMTFFVSGEPEKP